MLLYPRCPEVHYNRGLAYRRNGDLEQAAVDYTQAIELDPKFTVAYSNRGYVNFKLGDLAGALADFHKVLELDPAERRRAEEHRSHRKNAKARRFAMKWKSGEQGAWSREEARFAIKRFLFGSASSPPH